ncbi:MAG: CHRD domain-containing protein [Candidatus Eisenbacteria bacterium]
MSVALLLSSTFVFLALGAFSPAEAGRRPIRELLLAPQAVVPGPGDPTAAGSFSWKSGHDGFCFQVSVAQLDGFVEQITLHRGAAGARGTQVLRLSPSPIGINQLLGCAPADRALLREISGSPENFYVQVSTTGYPNGAMRGQLRQ